MRKQVGSIKLLTQQETTLLPNKTPADGFFERSASLRGPGVIQHAAQVIADLARGAMCSNEDPPANDQRRSDPRSQTEEDARIHPLERTPARLDQRHAQIRSQRLAQRYLLPTGDVWREQYPVLLNDARRRHARRDAAPSPLRCGALDQCPRGAGCALKNLLCALSSQGIKPPLLENDTRHISGGYGGLRAAEVDSDHEIVRVLIHHEFTLWL